MSKKKRFGVSSALSRGLSDTISIVENNTNILRSAVIPLSRIEVDPDNPRKLSITADDIRQGLQKTDSNFKQKEVELQKLQEVAHTIKTNGVLNPITVYKHGDLYRIIAGERRFLASLIAGLSEIDARVYNEPPKGFALKLVQWVENTAREDLTLGEKIDNIKDMALAYKKQNPSDVINATWLKNMTGLSLTQSTYYMSMLHAPDDVKAAIRNGNINSLDKASVIATIKQAELRGRAIEACISGLSLQKLKVLAGELKNMHKKPKDNDISLGKVKSAKVIEVLVGALVKLPEYGGLKNISANVKWDNVEEAKKCFRAIINIITRGIK